MPPGTLPLMSQPQYIMGNAYQPAIFPYPFQADVHYQATAAGREQNFQSVYSPGDATKFNRGADGEAPSISTTQAAGVASQTHNQPFVANALHPGYQLTYAMPGAFNMLPQNLYGAAPIFPTHIPQPTNTGSANTAYPKSTAHAYQSHTGYSGYDPLNAVPPQQTQDYVKQAYAGSNMQQQQQSSNKSMGSNSDIGVSATNANSMYGGSSKTHAQLSKQANYDSKSYQQQQSSNPAPQQFGFSHNTQQTASFPAPYPILPHSQQSLMQHHLQADNSGINAAGGQQQAQQKGAVPVAPNNSKYYGWN